MSLQVHEVKKRKKKVGPAALNTVVSQSTCPISFLLSSIHLLSLSEVWTLESGRTV